MDKDFIPPYPKPHKTKWQFFKGALFNLNSWIHLLMEKAYTMKLGSVPTPKIRFWLVNDKKIIKRIMETEPDKFPKHHMLHDMLKPLLGNSIFTTNGDIWKNQRKMVNPSFTHTNLKRVFDTMNGAVNVLMDSIAENNLKNPIEIDPLMTHVTADIIFRTILSTELNKEDAKNVLDSFNEFQEYAQKKNIYVLFKLPTYFLDKRINKSCKKIHDVFGPIIQKRYDEYYGDNPKKYSDILDSLLKARHPDTGDGFTYQDLLDQMSIIFLAGHETSATSLTWTLYLIAKCPDLQNLIYKEIKDNEIDGQITFETVKKLSMVKNVFMESLRLYPPVSFYPREVTEDGTKIRSKVLNKGTPLIVSPWLIQRSPDHFKNPNAFCPHRFDDEDQKQDIKDSYMPFGKGQRLCIGMGFAYQEGVLILANIVKKYELINPDGQVPEPVSRVTTRPKDGIKLFFKERL